MTPTGGFERVADASPRSGGSSHRQTTNRWLISVALRSTVVASLLMILIPMTARDALAFAPALRQRLPLRQGHQRLPRSIEDRRRQAPADALTGALPEPRLRLPWPRLRSRHPRQDRRSRSGRPPLRAVGQEQASETPRNCSGPFATLVEGHFIGEFDFRAELGVTEVDLTRAKGALAAPGWHCRKEGIDDFPRRAPSGSTYTFLQASLPGRPGGFTAFAGVDAEHPEPRGAEFSASARTDRGSVTVDHLAIGLAANAFSFDGALTSATVNPPSPFRGSATYCRSCAAGSQRTGDLGVLLPGIGHPVALTASAYRASLRSLAGGGASK